MLESFTESLLLFKQSRRVKLFPKKAAVGKAPPILHCLPGYMFPATHAPAIARKQKIYGSKHTTFSAFNSNSSFIPLYAGIVRIMSF